MEPNCRLGQTLERPGGVGRGARPQRGTGRTSRCPAPVPGAHQAAKAQDFLLSSRGLGAIKRPLAPRGRRAPPGASGDLRGDLGGRRRRMRDLQPGCAPHHPPGAGPRGLHGPVY